MGSFPDTSAANRTMTIDEYIESSHPEQRPMIDLLMKSMLGTLEFARRATGNRDEMPQFRVKKDDTIDASAGFGIIFINEGLINYCLGLECPLEIYDALNLPRLVGPGMKMRAFAFTMLHEFVHLARRHSESENVIGASSRVSAAMEHDADLLAIATLYRIIQSDWTGAFPDINVRALTLLPVFCFFRNLPDSHGNNAIHKPATERVFHLMIKLVQVNTDPRAPLDINKPSEESLNRLDEMAKIFAYLEIVFSHKNADTLDLLANINFDSPHSPFLDVCKAWDEVRSTVARVSGTLA